MWENCLAILRLSGLVDGRTSDGGAVDQGQVEWGVHGVRVGNGGEHSSVDDSLSGAVMRVDQSAGLVGVALVLAVGGLGDILQVTVSNVVALEPGNIAGSLVVGKNFSLLAVGSLGLSGCIPLEEDLSTSGAECGGVGSNSGTSSSLTDSDEIRLVLDSQLGEDREGDGDVVRWALYDVGAEQGPCPGLRGTSLEPDVDGIDTEPLTEGVLLTSLRGNRLKQNLCVGTVVEAGKEAVDSALSPSCELLTEEESLTHCVEGVRVLASLGCLGAEQVAQHNGVTNFLLCEESQQVNVILRETGVGKLLNGELGNNVVEEVQLDELLVNTKIQGVEVKGGEGGVVWVLGETSGNGVLVASVVLASVKGASSAELNAVDNGRDVTLVDSLGHSGVESLQGWL